MTGESSGDALAAWYIAKQRERGCSATYTAVGGAHLAAAGAHIYRSHHDLSVVGVWEVLRHLPRIWRIMREIYTHICTTGYDEVVLVDYPGVNLRLLKKLKKQCSQLRITYLSPPQLWVWGAWRVKTLRQYADCVIVLFPFEVAWYAQRGVSAQFLGCPIAETLLADCTAQSLTLPQQQKEYDLVILPGSRRQELTALGPTYRSVITLLKQTYPNLRVAVVVAPSLTHQEVAAALQDKWIPDQVRNDRVQSEVINCPEQHVIPDRPSSIVRGRNDLGPSYGHAQHASLYTYLSTPNESLRARAQSVCVLTKPGVNTLELALLGIPGAVIYKTSPLTYWLARCVVRVKNMALPNLLLGTRVYPEFIQKQCQPALIAAQLASYIEAYRHDRVAYERAVASLRTVEKKLT